MLMAFCRLAFRHGSWGEDYHAYHNEGHILEILGPRLERLIDTIGADALSLRDWFLLSLFGAAHDLRQREAPDFAAGIGSNERASVEETFRILRTCGFTPERNSELFIGIELMISGSTFDARPPTQRSNTTRPNSSCSPAVRWRRSSRSSSTSMPAGWRSDARVQHALRAGADRRRSRHRECRRTVCRVHGQRRAPVPGTRNAQPPRSGFGRRRRSRC